MTEQTRVTDQMIAEAMPDRESFPLTDQEEDAFDEIAAAMKDDL